MREFLYYSKKAVTSGKLIHGDMMKAGRMDIVLNVIIQIFFISNKMRDDVKLHLVFEGKGGNPKHLIFESNPEMPISKKDVGGLIKRMLYKSSGELKEIFPGCFIEDKNFESVLRDLEKDGKRILVLDERGKDIRKVKFNGGEVFVMGDHEGFGKKKKFLKGFEKISVGPVVYFASQVGVLINGELDRRLSDY